MLTNGIILVLGFLLYGTLTFADPLHDVAKEGDLKKVKDLLAHGAYVNVQDNNAETPLHMAVIRGQTGAIVLLLKHGAEINARDKNGDTALRFALRRGTIDGGPTRLPEETVRTAELVELLRQYGAKE